MPAQSRQQEWNSHKCTIWQLWVRDRLSVKELQEHMRLTMGFMATRAEYKKKFQDWEFSQNVPTETWKHVDYQIRSRKREGKDSTVLISGVQVPAERVRKETSRHFYTSLELVRVEQSRRPSGPWVYVGSPIIAPFNSDWSPTMPWLQFNTIFPFPNFNPRRSIQKFQYEDNAMSVLACARQLAYWGCHSFTSPSHIPQRLAAIMPESFQGEHILYTHSMMASAQGAELFAARLCMYRMSNGGEVSDEEILGLSDKLNLTKLIRNPSDPILKQITTRILLSNLMGVAIRQGRSDVLDWVLKLEAGVDPSTRQRRFVMNRHHGLLIPPYDRRLHFPLSLLLEDCLNQRHTICETWQNMIKILIAHKNTSIHLHCCGYHKTALDTAAAFQDPSIMKLVVDRGFEMQGQAYLDSLNWKVLYRSATCLAPDASIDDNSSFSYALELFTRTSAYQPGSNPLDFFMSPDGIVEASRNGNMSLLRQLGLLGANFNCFDQNGESPLGAATSAISDRWRKCYWPYSDAISSANKSRVCEELLSLGASPTLQDYTPPRSTEPFPPPPLHRAVDAVLDLLHSSDRMREDAMKACRVLLQKGADPNMEAYYSCRYLPGTGCPACREPDQLHPTDRGLRLLIDRLQCKHKVLATPLQRSVPSGDARLTLLLLEHGATIRDSELLHFVRKAKFYNNSSGDFRAVFAKIAHLRGSSPNRLALDMATRNRGSDIERVFIDFGMLSISVNENPNLSHNSNTASPDLIIYAFSVEQLSLTDCIATLKEHAPLYSGSGLVEALVKRLPESRRPSPQDLKPLQDVLELYPCAYSQEAIYDLCLFFGVYEGTEVLDIAKMIIARRPRTAQNCSRTIGLEYEHNCDIDGYGILGMTARSAIKTGNFELLDAELLATSAISIEAWPPLENPFNFFWQKEKELSEEDMITMRHRTNTVIARLAGAGHKPSTLSGLAATSSRTTSVDDIKKLMALGVDPCRRYSWSATTLQYATECQNIEVVRFLLDSGVDVNAPPRWSRRKHRPDCIPDEGTLLTTRAVLHNWHQWDNGHLTAFQIAVNVSNFQLMQMLLEAGADVNAPPAREGGATALQIACSHGEIGISKWLISYGAEVNADPAERFGRTSLEAAAEHGNLDTVHLLIDEGCDLHGPGRRRFISAVKLAENNNHHHLAAHLKCLGSWTEEDEKQAKHGLSTGPSYPNDDSGDDEDDDHEYDCSARTEGKEEILELTQTKADSKDSLEPSMPTENKDDVSQVSEQPTNHLELSQAPPSLPGFPMTTRSLVDGDPTSNQDGYLMPAQDIFIPGTISDLNTFQPEDPFFGYSDPQGPGVGE